MLRSLTIAGVGPAPVLRLEFGDRLNVVTGDNGLGKSFILDASWWAMTRRWPAEVNPWLGGGKMLRPDPGAEGTIRYSFDGVQKQVDYDSVYSRERQAWSVKQGRPAVPGLVVYAMADGGVALWDPHRNDWSASDLEDAVASAPSARPDAYVFRSEQIWDGLPGEFGQWHCNGLIRDWADWQREGGARFTRLKQILQTLSPNEHEALVPGALRRVSLDDVRDIPSVTMPYGADVPVVHLSAGMRRVIALAYILVWAWDEHERAAEQLGKDVTPQITMLVDEVESHLHPRWQQAIVPALLHTISTLNGDASVQLIAATHSPLIMASIEPEFDATRDAWFDLDFQSTGEIADVTPQVVLTRRAFEKRGDAASWLQSEAFDQPGGGRSRESSEAMQAADAFVERYRNDPLSADRAAVQVLHSRLVRALPEGDDYLFVWRHVCETHGWFE